jgi:putative copper export protein/mono/diheme cytochrome c family protein/peroxiredoxin
MVSALCCVGALVFKWRAGPSGARAVTEWRRQIARVALHLATVLALSGVGVAAMRIAIASGRSTAFLERAEWMRWLLQTRFGRIWILTELSALLLCACLTLRIRLRPWGDAPLRILALALCAAVLGSSAIAGHGASTEPHWLGQALYPVHSIVVAGWFGSLPALWLLLRHAATTNDGPLHVFVASAFQRFSQWAFVSIIIIVTTGAVAGWAQVRSVPNLLGTLYGWLVLAKLGALVLVLGIAAVLRRRWLPRYWTEPTASLALTMRRSVFVELTLALTAVALACGMASITPAAHDTVIWPLPFRLSLAATWDASPTLRMRILWGVVALAASGILAAGASRFSRRALFGALLCALGALVWIMTQLAVPAYPDTYITTPVAYQTVSIANGLDLFEKHCVVCHGSDGRGRGPLATTLPKPPADLTQPHTALHTAGDMYWWLTHGIPASGMPAMAGPPTEEDRWDVINFLRAFANGYQARILRPAVVPNEPWLGAPDFEFTDIADRATQLKDFRKRTPVLLVFFSWPASQPRLDELSRQYAQLSALPLKIVAVSWGAEGRRAGVATGIGAVPFPVLTAGTAELIATYLLFRRTLDNPGRTIVGEVPSHMELLIDRYGYVRARWIPEVDGSEGGWQRLEFMLAQVRMLNQERELRPPPDEHVH